MNKKSHILTAMKQNKIIFALCLLFVVFGIYALTKLNKDEFPQFTIRQGIVAAIYPGATAQEIEDQVTKPLEQFLFTYSEIDKKYTYSYSENGIVYVYTTLREEIIDKDAAWNKIKHGVSLFKKTSLPPGVLEVVVVDDFGNTSSMLLAIESSERTPREIETFAQTIADNLRTIPEIGNIKILGSKKEEIAVTIDQEKLSLYGIDQKLLLLELSTQGTRTISGNLKQPTGENLLQVTIPFDSEYAIAEHPILIGETSNNIKLKDIATIERRYAHSNQYVQYNGKNCVIISVEMYPGNDIVAFGDKVEHILTHTKDQLPPDINIHKITNQPQVVEDSVYSFLRDLLFSMVVVIAVMLLLFPLRTALIASSGVPVCTAITWAAMYMAGIELNTVTLAALIVVLGMIVDDSVIVIDGYTDYLERNHSRWFSAVESTRILFIPMSLATMSICGMFFPMTKIITGPLGDFVQLFPWTVTFALVASIFYAVWVIPYLCTLFIKKGNTQNFNQFERLQVRFFAWLQEGYNKLLQHCFNHPKKLLLFALACILLGVGLFLRLNVQMMPKAERNCFAIEIHLTANSSIEQTAAIVDSLKNTLLQDERVVSTTAFVGCASPRFHATYSPNMAKDSYAQFIVNTQSEEATAQILHEYAPLYEDAFPNAYVRFKQMDYQAVKNPVEITLLGGDIQDVEQWADSISTYLHTLDDLKWVHSTMDESLENIKIDLKASEANRYGITQSYLSLYLSSVLNGQTVTSVWEGDYQIPVALYSSFADSVSIEQLENLLIPTSIPSVWVPVKQIATLSSNYEKASLERRNSIPSVTIGCDLQEGVSQPQVMRVIDQYIKEQVEPHLPNNISIEYGGLTSANGAILGQIVLSLLAAILVLLAFLLYHFTKIDIALLALTSSLLCIFGAFLGLTIFDLDFSITAVLGLVSLIGIIVRNAIIMFEYAEELRRQNVPIKEAAFEAGVRRMRPIFLTSATTALGVVPMIIAQTSLWMPMGVVICFGTLFTLPLVVTVLPVAYWQIYKKDKK